MSIQIICIYCICCDLLSHLGIEDDAQCKMTSPEIMTFAIVSALFFQSNFAMTRRFFLSHRYFSRMLSHSKMSRRIHSIDASLWECVFCIFSLLTKENSSSEYIIDSFPAPACAPCRSKCCKLYHGKEYLGYCASKKMHYFGLKIHVMTTASGIPVEFRFTPASYHDSKALQCFDLDLQEGSIIYGDKAYTSYAFEDCLKEFGNINLLPQRQKRMLRSHCERIKHLINYTRKRIETTFSQITKLFPRSIAARTARGFELRIFLFILAFIFQQYTSVFVHC